MRIFDSPTLGPCVSSAVAVVLLSLIGWHVDLYYADGPVSAMADLEISETV